MVGRYSTARRIIIEYSSTPYVGMAQEKNGCCMYSVQTQRRVEETHVRIENSM